MSTVDLAREFARAQILQDHFKPVPDSHLTRGKGREATVSCLCGEKVELSFGQVEECDCRRIFWCGSKVYAAPAPTADDHDCEAARITLPDGVTVVADYCDTCKGDL